MKTSEKITNVAAALVKAQSKFPTIGFDATNPHFRNKYASLPQIVEKIRPILAECGLAIVQGATVPETNEGVLVGYGVETIVLHTGGEWISSMVYVPVEKPTAQAAGSALTYGRRYGVCALLDLVADGDDDGETASNHPPQQPQKPREAAGERPQSPPPAGSTSSGGHGGSSGRTVKTMPFGKNKGRPLTEIGDEDLSKTVEWCSAKDAEKFADLIDACNKEITRREDIKNASRGGFDDAPPPDAEDELPFD